MQDYTIRDLAGNEAVEALELADCGSSGGFADEVAEGWAEFYARTEQPFTAEEEAEMERLFARYAVEEGAGPDRTPPAGAMPVPVPQEQQRQAA